METRYKDALCDVISEMLVARMSVVFTSRGLWCDSEFARLFSEMPSIESTELIISVHHSLTMKHRLLLVLLSYL